MDWILEGRIVKAMYIGKIPIYGKIHESRIAYGGKIKHHIELIEPISVFGSIRKHVQIDEESIVEVM